MVEKTDVVKADLEQAWSLHLQESESVKGFCIGHRGL